jgi:ubiquinone/menaquinone biosynthesis C-methylase UbiE
MAHVHPTAGHGFSRGAASYGRSRPSYPPEAVEWIAGRLGLAPGVDVVEVGAGTGLFTAFLLETGASVTAVEPVAAMREQLVERFPGCRVLEGVAETLPLPDASADAAAVAQAFHWFQPDAALAELHRVLRRGASLALVWNLWDLDDPLQAELDAIVKTALTPDAFVVHPTTASFPSGGWLPALEASPLFGQLEERRFRYEHELERERLVDRVSSVSFVATLPDEPRARLLARVDEIVRRSPPLVSLRFVTVGYRALRTG